MTAKLVQDMDGQDEQDVCEVLSRLYYTFKMALFIYPPPMGACWRGAARLCDVEPFCDPTYIRRNQLNLREQVSATMTHATPQL